MSLFESLLLVFVAVEVVLVAANLWFLAAAHERMKKREERDEAADKTYLTRDVESRAEAMSTRKAEADAFLRTREAEREYWKSQTKNQGGASVTVEPVP